MRNLDNEPLLEFFIFETLELISQLENIALTSEKGMLLKPK